MRWRVAWSGAALLVLAALAALAGCGRGWIEERAPWRHDAEVQCLKSGAVKPSAAIVALRPIAGPGICGADFPLKVIVLGEAGPTGFADDLRPPGSIPGDFQMMPASPPPRAVGPGSAVGLPMPIGPPIAASPSEQPPSYEPYPDAAGYGSPAPTAPLPPETVPLGPGRMVVTSAITAIVPPATLACPMVSALDTFVNATVQPVAMRWFGQQVVEIRQISAYSCRPMNGQRGAPISEHAFGNALDIAGFTLADGRRVRVRDGWHGAPEERGFLHDVHAAACQQFSTVLAPGSNAFHYDHIHVDLARHASGRTICEPRPVPGDLVAGRGDPPVTGSVGGARGRAGATASGIDDTALPPAIAGAD